jgi:hypothetical protein
MASVPGPDPDRPLPRPAAPAQEPEREEQWEAAPDEAPSWLPEPYDPAREQKEREAVPL